MDLAAVLLGLRYARLSLSRAVHRQARQALALCNPLTRPLKWLVELTIF